MHSLRNPYDDEIDPRELAMGVEEEFEHTDDPNTARRIALDHLTEDPHYYSRLKRCFAEKNPFYGPELTYAAKEYFDLLDRLQREERLSPRQTNVLFRLATGDTASDIAKDFGVTQQRIQQIAQRAKMKAARFDDIELPELLSPVHHQTPHETREYPKNTLSAFEEEVLYLRDSGLTNVEVAKLLGITDKGKVSRSVYHARKKLGLVADCKREPKKNPISYVNQNVDTGRGSGLKLIVRNRYDSEFIPPPITEPYVVISIYTPGDSQPNLAAHNFMAESIAIRFYDVPYEPGDVHAEVRAHLFMPAEARAIASFVADAKERGINTVVVHCDMGQSRSVAIAAALSLYYNDTVGKFTKGRRYQPVGSCGFQTFNPNPRIFHLTVDALFGEDDG